MRKRLYFALCGVCACTVVGVAPRIATAQYPLNGQDGTAGEYTLAVPGQPRPQSTAEISDRMLIIRDSQGRSFVYVRSRRLDTRDGRYLGYYSSKYRQGIRWPKDGTGSIYIRRGFTRWNEGRMQIVSDSPQGTPGNGPGHPGPGHPGPGQPGPELQGPEPQGDGATTDAEPPLLKPKYVGTRRIHGSSLPSVTVTLKNSSSDDLHVRITDTANGDTTPIVFTIPARRSVQKQLTPVGPDVLEKIYLVPSGEEWKKEIIRTTLPAKQRFRIAVYRHKTTYRYINRLNNRNPLQGFSRKSAVSVGVFSIAGSTSLVGDKTIDVYRSARRQQNPGAVSRYGASRYSSRSTSSDRSRFRRRQ